MRVAGKSNWRFHLNSRVFLELRAYTYIESVGKYLDNCRMCLFISYYFSFDFNDLFIAEHFSEIFSAIFSELER